MNTMEFDSGDAVAAVLDLALAWWLGRAEFALFALALLGLFDNGRPLPTYRAKWRSFATCTLLLLSVFAVCHGPLLPLLSLAISLGFVAVAVDSRLPVLRQRAPEFAFALWVLGTLAFASRLGAIALLRVQLCLLCARMLPRLARRSTLASRLERAARKRPILAFYVVVNVLGAVWEMHAGLVGNSLALASDAGHMLFDAAAALIAIVAEMRGERALGAYTNGLLLLFLALYICVEAFQRFLEPQKQDPPKIYIAAGFGLCVNVVCMLLAHPHDGCDANAHGAWLHMCADLAASVAVIVSVALIERIGWLWIDPLASVLVAALVVGFAQPQLVRSARELRAKRKSV